MSGKQAWPKAIGGRHSLQKLGAGPVIEQAVGETPEIRIIRMIDLVPAIASLFDNDGGWQIGRSAMHLTADNVGLIGEGRDWNEAECCHECSRKRRCCRCNERFPCQ
jgi:hypothetical protein